MVSSSQTTSESLGTDELFTFVPPEFLTNFSTVGVVLKRVYVTSTLRGSISLGTTLNSGLGGSFGKGTSPVSGTGGISGNNDLGVGFSIVSLSFLIKLGGIGTFSGDGGTNCVTTELPPHNVNP